MSDDPGIRVPFPSDDTSAIERIIYISLPEDIDRQLENFEIDSSIPLPVEPPPGVSGTELDNLSWEMIISAMLKLFAYQPEHPHIDYFRDFIFAVQPDIVAEMTRMGIVKARAKEYGIAEEIFRSLVNLAPEVESTFVNLALLFEESAAELQEEGREEEAEKLKKSAFSAYRQACRYHPRSAQIHYNTAHFYLQRSNIQKSREHFRKYLELDTENTEKRQQIKSLLKELESKDRSDELFAEAYDLIKMGQEASGIRKIREFLENNPDVWNGWFLLGWGLRKTGAYEEARSAFLKSIELNNSNPDAFNELAICNLELEEFQQARNNLERALKLEPENTKVMSNMGILALKQGDFELAKRFFQTVLELDPEDPVAPVYLDKINEQS